MDRVQAYRHVISDLARLAASFEFTDEARTAAIEAVMDTVTAAVAAPRFPFLNAVHEVHGHGHSAIWFSGKTASPIGSAFANALSSAALDLDDGHRPSRGHPGAAVVPAVIAQLDQFNAQHRLVDDDTALKSVAVGYEIGLRVAAAKNFYARTGFWAGIAAAAAVASLRQLPAEQTSHALAIAAETGPHMATTTAPPAWPQASGTDVKEGIPWGVANGLAAVSLANGGMTGPLDLLDHAPFFDPELMLSTRKTPLICETYTKFYAACRHIHGPVEALAGLMSKHALAWQNILKISVETYSGALRISNRVRPATLVDAQYSIPYCLGLTAVCGLDKMATMDIEDLGITPAENVAERVILSISEKLEREFPARTLSRITLETDRGTFVSSLTAPSGEADDRPDWDRRVEKLLLATSRALSPDDRNELLNAMEALRSGKLSDLRARLSTHHAPPQGH